MIRRQTLLFLIFVMSLTACSRSINQTPNPNDVATQVNLLLTTIPSTPQASTSLPTIPPITATPPSSKRTPTGSATTSAPTATQASNGTQAPTPQPSLPVSDPKLTLGSPTRVDKMDNPGAWGIYSNSHATVQSKQGTLSLTALNPDGWTSWTLTDPKLLNFYAEATLKPEACSGADHYGLVFRAQASTQAYLFGVSCEGRFSFLRFDGSTFITVVDWTESSAITTGVNRLGVMAKADQFSFNINGIKVGEAKDSTYSEGPLGLFVTSMVTPNFTVDAQEVDYWVLP